MSQKHAHGLAGEESTGCSCCSHGLKVFYEQAAGAFLSRRHVLFGAGAAALAGWGQTARAQEQAPAASQEPRFVPTKELVVQPVLTYQIHERREKTSWRPWGGVMTAADVEAEVGRIERELGKLKMETGLPVRFLPVVKVCNPAEAQKVRQSACDVALIYAAGAGPQVLDAAVSPDRPTLFFLRHRSGPVSRYYEVLHPYFLRKSSDEYKRPGVDVQDVVVDEYADLAWRLRALVGLRRTLGQRIVAIGGPAGWGEGRQIAPEIARKKWHLDIRTVEYDEVGRRIKELRANDRAVAEARTQAGQYLKDAKVELNTDGRYVENAFLLTRMFRDLLAKHEATAITINNCMGTIMPLADTTACMTLSLLNDEGFVAFCESDFVVIPSGLLMHHILGTPVFLNDPTWPHHGMVTLAHCTAPRRMDGKKLDPVKIHTHFESDFGAAPKVEMELGQEVTMVVPDFGCQKWVGAKGKVLANPFHAICRSQIDVSIDGDCDRLVQDMRGFHWMLGYGDCRREIGYAIKHLGVAWEDVSV